MKTCDTMQKFIEKLATKHNLDLTVVGSHLKLENEPYEPLCIETIGKHLVSVAHYYEQNGDLVPDPDIVFFTGYGPWVPISMQQWSGLTTTSWLAEDGEEIEKFLPRKQMDIASFCRIWARNLKEQGFLNAKEV